jgi:ATP-dependent helicase IRC3
VTITLRPYQTEALGAVRTAYGRGVRRQLVCLPTGTGKTILFAKLIRARGARGRALVLAHRDELVQQAASKLHDVWPEITPGIVKAEQDESGAPVVVACVQTVARSARLARLLAAGPFATVVVDEAHHATGETYRRVLEALGAFEPSGPLTVGVTATPVRADRVGLGTVFEEIVFERDILSMVEDGYLADIRGVRVKLAADFNKLQTTGGDFIDAQAADMLMAANAPKHAVCAYTEHAAGRPGIVFTPTVAVARAMAEAFVSAGIAAATVDGMMPTVERRRTLAAFSAGELAIIANCGVLTEGYDEPRVSCVVVARPTRSKGLYTQMVGRGTRLHPMKRDLLVIDLVGATGRLDLVTAATLFGVSEAALESGATVGRIEAQRRAAEVARVETDRLVAEAVDVFQRHELAWCDAGAGRYVLSLGGGAMVVLQATTATLQSWDVLQVEGTGKGSSLVIAAALSLGYAQGTAEDLVRKAGAQGLNVRRAAWRAKAPSQEQEALLREWGLWRAELTRGEAAERIRARLAKRVDAVAGSISGFRNPGMAELKNAGMSSGWTGGLYDKTVVGGRRQDKAAEGSVAHVRVNACSAAVYADKVIHGRVPSGRPCDQAATALSVPQRRSMR